MATSASKIAEKNRLIWVDLEMTGLDENTCYILEIACVITDADLQVIAEAPDIVIHQPDDILDGMNDWCKEHHGKSGLTDAVRASTISVREAEETMLQFVRKYTAANSCPLAGNTIYMDKKFLSKYMPRFTSHLHYRIVDVSTVKELCRRWYSAEFKKAPAKAITHRALDDIRESITELQYYRSSIFR